VTAHALETSRVSKNMRPHGIELFYFFSFVYQQGIYLLASFNALTGGEADDY
jgi:hypothetical protein